MSAQSSMRSSYDRRREDDPRDRDLSRLDEMARVSRRATADAAAIGQPRLRVRTSADRCVTGDAEARSRSCRI
jgi:hypothetical protein